MIKHVKKNILKKKRRKKPSIVIKTALSFLLVPLMIFSLAACTQSRSPKPKEDEVPAGPRIITDMAGRQVEIPAEVKTIAYVYGLVGNVLFTFGAQEMIVGVQGSNSFFEMLYPDIADVPLVGRSVADLEALANVGPDIYIGRAYNVNDLEAVQSLGIPAIGISAESLDEIAVLYNLIGDIIGQEEKAAELIAYYNSIYDQATKLVSDIPDNQRATAILMGADIASVAHAKMIQSEMIVAAGGISCVVDSSVPTNKGIWPTAGTETIFAWNPDFIFITNSWAVSYTAEDILKDPAWVGLKAVINGNVYTVPCNLESWEFPGLGTSLGTLWMASKMYPQVISKAKFNTIATEYYKRIYGLDVTPEFLGL